MKRILGFLVFGALAACSAQGGPVDSVNQGIVNGTTDTGDPSVVMVLSQVSGSNMASLCTGEVISPHVVLTAAHCVDPATVGANAKTVVFIGDVLTQTSPSTDFLTVQTVSWDMMFDSNNPQNGHDVGVAVLAEPTTLAPLPYQRDTLPQSQVGMAARLVGFGITMASDTMGTTAGTRRQAPTTLANLDDLFVGLQDGAHGICEGDSGGPAFMTLDGIERIVGVTSFGFQNCPLTPPSGTPPGFKAGNDTNIATYSTSFIDPIVLMYDPPAKGVGTTCTSNADCTPRLCEDEGNGKVCVQSCDPAVATSCPAGTTCTAVNGNNVCLASSSGGGSGGSGGGNGAKSGGCAIGAVDAPVGSAGLGLGLLFAVVALVALRRHARA